MDPSVAGELSTGENKELSEADELELEPGEKSENVEIPPVSIEVGSGSASDTLMATQAIINRQAERLDGLKDEAGKVNDSLKSILENDTLLSDAEGEAKEATKKIKERRAQLTQGAESVQLKFKLREIREQIKELEESLNNHLLNYYQLTGTKVFDTDSGQQREFKVTARILGKKRPEKDE